MRLYDNAWPSIYEEIKTWYPIWYRDIVEMDAIWQMWGTQLDKVQSGIIHAINNNFIDSADRQTIGRLEGFLSIIYDGPRTLVERKNVIKALLLGRGHIGQKEIRELISILTVGEIEISLVSGKIQITVTRDESEDFNLYDFHLVLDNRIPAHLALDIIDKLFPVSVQNQNRLHFQNLNTRFSFEDFTEILQHESVGFSGLKTKQSFNLSGSIIMDSQGTLSGVFLLDGSKNLNQKYVEEAL